MTLALHLGNERTGLLGIGGARRSSDSILFCAPWLSGATTLGSPKAAGRWFPKGFACDLADLI